MFFAICAAAQISGVNCDEMDKDKPR